MPRSLLLALTLSGLTAGCLFDPCGTQSRFLDASAPLAGATPADTGTAVVNFLQFRGNDDQQSLTWFIRGTVDTGAVTAVHIHRGGTGQTGEILFTFENGYSGPGDVITQSGPQLWSDTIEYEELFALIRAGKAYIDVHTTGTPDGALRGQLTVLNERDWQDSCT